MARRVRATGSEWIDRVARTRRAMTGLGAGGPCHRPLYYSDLDLALEAESPLDTAQLGRLRDALSESDLTIKVDVLDLRVVDPAFKRIINIGMLPLQLHDAET